MNGTRPCSAGASGNDGPLDAPTDGMEPCTTSTIVPYDRWRGRTETLRAEFLNATPFPHVVLEDFLLPQAARRVWTAFPPLGEHWTHYLHYNERKFGMNDLGHMPTAAKEVFDELNSPSFVSLLCDISGIASLRADPALEGGGLHQSERGGYLNLHADFTVHPHHADWRRRLNLLIYLNPEWDESWGGHLELWDSELRACVKRIAPLFNRAVLFRTDERSFHGHPDPLTCPPGIARKSMALYYFTVEATLPRAISTEYRGRPSDGPRRALIFLDKMALRLYDRAKRTFGFDDAFATRVLRTLASLRNRR